MNRIRARSTTCNTLYDVQVNPKQFLAGTELQYHECDPLEDTRQHVGHREQMKNTVLPHHDSRPSQHMNGLHTHNSKPSADDLSHQRNVGKPVKSGLRYSHSMSHHDRAVGDQRHRGGVMKYLQPKSRQSGPRQGGLPQSHDNCSPPAYDRVPQHSVHEQNVNDLVRVAFLVLVLLVCAIFISVLSYSH